MKRIVQMLLIIFITPLIVWLAYRERGYFAIGSEYLVVPLLVLWLEIKPYKKY